MRGNICVIACLAVCIMAMGLSVSPASAQLFYGDVNQDGIFNVGQ